MRRHSRSESIGKTPETDWDSQRDVKVKKKSNFVKDYLIDYTSNSNLHGLKYLGEKQRTSVERVFWFFVFTCCVVLCAGLIRKVWIKWNVSPVIVSFAESSTPVWQIPYPAVTVCLETKAKQSVFNFTEYYHLYNDSGTRENLTTYERNLYEDVTLVCDDHLAPPQGRKFGFGNETVTNIKEVSPNITDAFFGCKWKDIPKETCSDLFSPILTEEGLCYTFNNLGANELFRMENIHKDYQYLEHQNVAESWSLEDGYAPMTPIETYPHRGSGYGAKAGLTFLMKTKQIDLDFLCRGPVQGFKILLHNPAELPRLSQQYFRSPLSQEVVVAVKPKMMTTSEGLRAYDPNRRQCYFPSERYLKYFKIYTQSNCEMECLTNFTYARCGCVHFGMPHGPEMKVCNAGSMACIKKVQMELVVAEVEAGLEKRNEENDTIGEARKIASRCKCLPACTSIEYEAETSQADYDWKAIFRAYKLEIPPEMNDMMYSRVMIFFKEPQFITSRRSELYGQTDFLANCGGLLGLFMGFSILSVVEILYFFTLRLWCVVWNRRRNKKNASDLHQAGDMDVKSDKLKQNYKD
ncbi:pickpocket protein 28-like isoform X2 [Galleria mellonella]|uniref:Pickpocket protein 28-like isoform X2 n=1 Tax=Galleria mellonella TaxID=7137 RepID=A0ABM3N033_GALME|nr:pickpocket protein 28-like isoform X2 [Galleria mellonella]